MPEGPEILVSRDWLRSAIRGRFLVGVEAVGGRYRDAPPTGLVELRQSLASSSLAVTDVGAKGKLLWWTLEREGERWFVCSTYGMSGQWSPEQTKHAAIRADFDMLSLWFNDQRHFGTFRAFRHGTDCEFFKILARLGPDMLQSPPDPVMFQEALMRRPGWQVGVAIMDQSVISGVGNYVRAEALYRAALSPLRKVSELSEADFIRLRASIIEVLRESYEAGGTTLQTYYAPDGARGTFADRLRVYGRKADPEGREVRRDKTSDGRTVWWVPTVQL